MRLTLTEIWVVFLSVVNASALYFFGGSTEALMKNGVYLNNYGYNSAAW